MLHTSLPVRDELNLRKQTMPFQFHNLKSDTYTIICGVKLYSFSTNFFLLVFLDYLEHQWNLLKYNYSVIILDSKKMLTECN